MPGRGTPLRLAGRPFEPGCDRRHPALKEETIYPKRLIEVDLPAHQAGQRPRPAGKEHPVFGYYANQME